MNTKITAYKNIYATEPHYLTIDEAINRIKLGRSKEMVNEIRSTQDKNKASELKKNLPSICFSGVFKERKDECLIEHSGYMILDFDHVENVETKKEEVFKYNFVKAAWISPSGNGVKALIKIADKKKHKEHFQSLQDIFKDLDKSGVNVSRVCFESYDEKILVRQDEVAFAKYKKIDKVSELEVMDKDATFDKILIWLNNTGSAFVSGERNLYIYKLASACCRFGIYETNCTNLIHSNITNGTSDFSKREIDIAIHSAYKSNGFGTAEFKNERLVDKATTFEIEIDESFYNTDVRPKDVIYGIDCKQDAINLYRNGY